MKSISIKSLVVIIGLHLTVQAGHLGNTPVKTNRGVIGIEKIKINDRVLGLFPAPGGTINAPGSIIVESEILQIHDKRVDGYYCITLDDEELYVSGDQLFYDANALSWVQARDLTTESVLIDINAEIHECVTITYFSDSCLVYDITISEPNFYFIGNAKVLTHNHFAVQLLRAVLKVSPMVRTVATAAAAGGMSILGNLLFRRGVGRRPPPPPRRARTRDPRTHEDTNTQDNPGPYREGFVYGQASATDTGVPAGTFERYWEEQAAQARRREADAAELLRKRQESPKPAQKSQQGSDTEKKDPEPRKENTVEKSEFFKKTEIKENYENFKDGAKRLRDNGEPVGDKDAYFMKWDHLHKDVEIYNRAGKHIGSLDPNTLEMYKRAVEFRELFSK